MAGFSLYQQALTEFSAIGPKRLSTEFELVVLDNNGGIIQEFADGKLKYLVKTAQIPSMKNFVVEHNILFGISGRDIGPPDIEHTMQIAFSEAVDSRVMRFLQNWYTSRNRYDVQLTLVGPNDTEGGTNTGKVFTLKSCFCNRDAVDLDVSSNTEAINVQVELVYAYVAEFFNSTTGNSLTNSNDISASMA
jgi:hypothetical protein